MNGIDLDITALLPKGKPSLFKLKDGEKHTKYRIFNGLITEVPVRSSGSVARFSERCQRIKSRIDSRTAWRKERGRKEENQASNMNTMQNPYQKLVKRKWNLVRQEFRFQLKKSSFYAWNRHFRRMWLVIIEVTNHTRSTSGRTSTTKKIQKRSIDETI